MLRRRRSMTGTPMPAKRTPPGARGLSGLLVEFMAVAAAVAMVRVEVAALPFTATDADEKLQVAPVGRPEQDRATV